jgi:type IX secretion system PorP/SprF family membrane protein
VKKLFTFFILASISSSIAKAQGMHFSQYYNAPMLLNPANTGFLQDNDWRAGVNLRNQWATTPIPYNTFSAFADFGLMRDKWETSWIGTGLAMWRDVAGNGNLALTKIQANLAYHLLVSDRSTLSAGLGMSYNQRSVDISKLTFDVQWDEFSFNKGVSNQETFTRQKSTYMDMSAGMNYSYANNNNLFITMSVGGMHINQPIETFYGMSNRKGFRPIANLDIVFKASDNVMLNPSVYYTREKKASELVMGSLFNINTGGGTSIISNELILGAFYRNKDAVIAAAGYKFKQNKFIFSYDHTISQMSQGNNGLGAFELSLILQGNYKKGNELSRTYGCPRF